MGNAESSEPIHDDGILVVPPMYDENNSDIGNRAREKGGNGSPFEPIMVSESGSPRHKHQRQRQRRFRDGDDDDDDEEESRQVPATTAASTDSSSGIEASRDDKYDGYTAPSDATSTIFGEVDDHDGVISLMEASAAIFDLLDDGAAQSVASGNDRYARGHGQPSVPSEAVAPGVFRYLKDESQKGNTKAVVNFLETASVVSAYIQKQKNRPDPTGGTAGGAQGTSDIVAAALARAAAGDGEHSVSNESAAVFQLLDDLKSVDHESAHVSAVFQLLDEAQSVVANDAASVSERSAGIFALLDEAQSVDDQSLSQFSSAVFKVLDGIKKAGTMDEKSVSEASAAIFQMLDEKSTGGPRTPRNKARYSQPPHITTIDEASGIEQNPINLISIGDPTATAPIYNIKLAPGTANDPDGDHKEVRSIVINDSLTEAERNETAVTPRNGYYQAAQKQQEDYPELAAALQPRNHGPHTFQAAPYLLGRDDDESTLTKDQYRNDVQMTYMKEEIDLEFVENFDAAFNEFVGQHPQFLMKDPDLAHSLRVTKLQKLLEFNAHCELQLKNELNGLRVKKAAMEEMYQAQLKEASRKKAAREINLQGDLNKLHLATKQLSAKLLWDLVSLAERKSKQQAQMRQHYKNMITQDKARASHMKRHHLFELIPPGPDGQKVRDAVLAPSSTYGRINGPRRATALSAEQEKDLRRFQVDNAFLNAEVTVLKKKLAYQKQAAKKHAWVESVLLRMDKKTKAQLAERFQMKSGVKF